MLFLVQSSLLGGLQTFVGVVITLIVLCIKDNATSSIHNTATLSSNSEVSSSNYIRTIIGYIRIDRIQYMHELTFNLKSRISKIAKDFDESLNKVLPSKIDDFLAIKKEMENLRTEAENWMLAPNSDYNLKLIDYNKELNIFYERNYDSLMALFILCTSMTVMLLDCLGLSSYFIYPFVVVLTFFIIIYSINVWHAFYYGMKEESSVSLNGFDMREHSTWIVYDGIIVSLFIFFFSICPMKFMGVTITILSFIVIEFLLHKYIFTFSCLTAKNFTKTELLIHVFHFLIVSIIAGIVSFLIANSLMSNDAPNLVSNEVFNPNVSVLRRLDITAYLFAFVIAFDAFFLPIIISFVFCYRKALPVKRLYDQKAKDINKEMDSLINRYNQLMEQA